MRLQTYRSDAADLPVVAVQYNGTGRPVAASMMVTAAVGRPWRLLRERGGRLTAMRLSGGRVSVAIEHNGRTYQHTTVDHPRHIPRAVYQLLSRFDVGKFDAWLRQRGG